MRNILKISDTTTIQNIKQGTFRYVQQVCEEGIGIRYGGAIASYIEAEAFYMSGGVTEVNEGDVIYYYQERDVYNDFTPRSTPEQIRIGIFTVDKCIRENDTYIFIAYDNLKKLDVDFSARLLELKPQFPMTVKNFLDEIASFVSNLGVTIYFNYLNIYSISNANYVNYFYVNGITVRDIVSQIAEISLAYAYCPPSGVINFNYFSINSLYWKKADNYIIAPTDQVTYRGMADVNGVQTEIDLVPIFYKQDGLKHEGYSFAPTDYFHIYNTDGYEVYGDVVITPATNEYNIFSNLFADYITVDSLEWSDITVWYYYLQTMLNTYSIVPFEVHLFPFRNPFNAGQILPHVVDKDGNRISSAVMKMEVTDFEVILTCSGQEYYQTSSYGNYDTDNNLQAISAAIGGKVSKSGDTMTGTLTMNGTGSGTTGDIRIKNTSYARGDTPGSASIRRLVFTDKNDATVALVAGDILTDGSSRIRLGSANVGGSNNVSLLVDSNGVKSVSVDDPVGWRRAIGLNYAVNDTFSITGDILAGYISNATKTAYLIVTTEKSLEDISTVTVQTLTGRIRGINGYVDGASSDADWTSGYTVIASKLSNNQVEVRITKSSAFTSATNNTPVTAAMSVTLKFT